MAVNRTVTRREIAKILGALKDAGHDPARVELRPGEVVIFTLTSEAPKDELAEWRAKKHGRDQTKRSQSH